MGIITKLSAPWVLFYREVEAMFAEDPAVRVEFDNGDEKIIKLYVDGERKAEALSELLPIEKEFGNVVVKIEVIPANILKGDKAQLFRDAFDGNPALSYDVTVDGVFSNPVTYFVFKKAVVQYYADNLGDVNGLQSTLYQNIAEDLFENHDGVSFCTDSEEE